jgi:hypothetical protein
MIVGGGVGGSALATVLARGRRLRYAASIVSVLDCEFDEQAPARRERYFERMQADPSLAVGLAVALAGPEMLPAEAFSEQTRARILER